MLFKASFLFLFTAFFLLTPQDTLAESIQNNYYKVENFEIQEGKIPSPNEIPQTQGNINNNFIISFPYKNTSVSESINPVTIEYGSLNPGEPITRTQSINISKDIQIPLTVFISEDHPLQSTESASIQIPNTTCDDGTCTANLSSRWINLLTFGFGFHCQGIYCNAEFPYANLYKSFSPVSHEFNPLFSVPSSGRSASSIVTYKVNSSPNMPQGVKHNTIDIITVPGF